MVPTIVRALMRKKNGMSSSLLSSKFIVAANVVNIVQYIPVAEATAGLTSSWIRNELKITPGPIPDIAAKRAAKKATSTKIVIRLGFKS